MNQNRGANRNRLNRSYDLVAFRKRNPTKTGLGRAMDKSTVLLTASLQMKDEKDATKDHQHLPTLLSRREESMPRHKSYTDLSTTNPVSSKKPQAQCETAKSEKPNKTKLAREPRRYSKDQLFNKNLISITNLRKPIEPKQSQEYPQHRSQDPSTQTEKPLSKDRFQYYQGQTLTPKNPEFKIFLEGDPLTKIFGHICGPDLLKRHQCFNQKLMRRQDLYEGRSRGVRMVIRWKC